MAEPLPTLELREATPEDAPLVLRLTLAAYAEYRDTLVPASGVFSETLDEVRAEVKNGGVVIAWCNGEPVGCGRSEIAPDRSHLYVGRLAVLPAARGQRIATQMLAWFEIRAVDLGLPEVQLGVRLMLPRNILLYERAGFETFGYEERPGYGRISAWMRKRVGVPAPEEAS